MPQVPRLPEPDELTDLSSSSLRKLTEKVNNQVSPSDYGAILPPTFLRREGARSAVQHVMMVAAFNRIGLLCEWADDPNLPQRERHKAVQTMFQYGIGERINVTVTDSKLLRVICRILSLKFSDSEMEEFLDTVQREIGGSAD